MITLKEYHIIERYNFSKGAVNSYYYDFDIYNVSCYKIFGIIPLFKKKVLIKSGRDNCYRHKPKRKQRY